MDGGFGRNGARCVPRGYLTRDGVFPEHLLDECFASKRKDIEEMRVVPHPWEVARYYDI